MSEVLENVSNQLLDNGFSRPGPVGQPGLGVLGELQDDAPGFLLRSARKYGNLVPMMVGPLRVWLVAHPDAVDHVCRSHASNYVKTRFAEKLKPLLGNGVATSNGSLWEASRSVIHPMLKPAEISRMVSQMDEVIRSTIANWTAQASVIDMAKESCALTLRVISRTMFGEGNADNVARVVGAIDEVQAGLKDYIWSADPDHGPDPSVTHPGFAAALNQVFDAVREIIAKRRQNPIEGDLLSALMNARNPETGELYSDQQVLDEVMTIYMAGHETTGNTLSWLWETLARNPELQEEVRLELLHKIPLDRAPSLEDLRDLPITNAILQETMRLKPSAFWFARTALEDDVIMGQPVLAGDSFFVSQYVVQRLEEFWPNPDVFDYTRWLNGNKPAHKFAHLPFGAGVRTCPGGHFAMAEMTLIMARALAAYVFALPEKDTPPRPYEALVTLRPENGMPLMVSPFEKTYYMQGLQQSSQLLDACLQLRRRVFVENMKWPLQVNDKGQELDQFDQPETGYFAHIEKGELLATARVIPAEKPSLLYNVFSHLINDPVARLPRVGTWEGARLAVTPELNAHQSRAVCATLLAAAIRTAIERGISHIYTVSDPVMERVLVRAGAAPERLGPVVIDQYGIPALALKINCSPEILENCLIRSKSSGAQKHTGVTLEDNLAA